MPELTLHARVARCRPSSCDRKFQCLRFVARIPSVGGTVADFSVQKGLWCDRFVSLADGEPQVQRQAVKPWPAGGED